MKTSQKQRVLNYMRTHDGITSMQAFELGITRLSAIIWDLRHNDGIAVDEEMVTATTRYGDKAQFAKYYLGELI